MTTTWKDIMLRDRNLHFRLKGKNIESCSLMEWGESKEKLEDIIKQNHIDDKCFVSTVFLGMECSGGMFETMIFCAAHTTIDLLQERCKTYDEALIQHQEMIKRVHAYFLINSAFQ